MSDLDQYDYSLPTELIAQHPLPVRSDARLMIVDRAGQSIEHAHVRDLPQWLRAGDCIALNETRVIPARLMGRRERTGGAWEGLYLGTDAYGSWNLLAKTRGKPEPGETIQLFDSEGRARLRLTLLARLDRGMWRAQPDSLEGPLELLEAMGHIPLPHYIRGGTMMPTDRATYQTVYAAEPGAVAAPTAGLHFTPALLKAIERAGVEIVRVVLHVGMGTFLPISVDRLEDHAMHSERGRITAPAAQAINDCRARGGRCIAIGTTSVRVLETAAASGHLASWEGETNLFIRPPYRFQAVDCLMTNFHLPRSTLLVLTRCFGGDALIRRAYREAIAEGYRFYSYGDAMLIV